MALLLTLVFLALFVSAFVWIIRYAKAQQEAKEAQIQRAGFRRNANPQVRQLLITAWGSIEASTYVREHPGYKVWLLEQSDSEDATPFLAVMFDEPRALPRDAWILAAVVKEEGLAMKMLSGLAHLSGHKHRLIVPPPFSARWFAWGTREVWMPQAPPEAFWAALDRAPSLSVRFAQQGIKVELLPTPGTLKTPGDELLTSRQTLSAVESIADAFLHR